jgi:hypothetical protein
VQLVRQHCHRTQREKVQTEERIVNGNAAKGKQAQCFFFKSGSQSLFSSKSVPLFLQSFECFEKFCPLNSTMDGFLWLFSSIKKNLG